MGIPADDSGRDDGNMVFPGGMGGLYLEDPLAGIFFLLFLTGIIDLNRLSPGRTLSFGEIETVELFTIRGIKGDDDIPLLTGDGHGDIDIYTSRIHGKTVLFFPGIVF